MIQEPGNMMGPTVQGLQGLLRPGSERVLEHDAGDGQYVSTHGTKPACVPDSAL